MGKAAGLARRRPGKNEKKKKVRRWLDLLKLGGPSNREFRESKKSTRRRAAKNNVDPN